jgi:hypothetical protein
MASVSTSRAKRVKASSIAPATAEPAGRTPGPESAISTTNNALALAPVEKLTEVKAKVDVGGGNALFIRGQGEGLSWDKGRPLVCTDRSTWVWSTRRAGTGVVFKLLLNDRIWAAGADRVVQAGQRLEVVPQFPASAV